MNLKTISLSCAVAGLLGSCAVPSYPVDPYAGSLNQCLDIQGTYENGNYFGRGELRKRPDLYSFLLPERFNQEMSRKRAEGEMSLWERTGKENEICFKKSWVTFQFFDNQHLTASVFNVEGQVFTKTFDMQKRESFPWNESEEFTCNQSSWQRSYSVSRSTEGHGTKWRIYSKTTKLPGGTLRMEVKSNTWGGYFPGLYLPNKGDVDSIGYFRKVDLTVDDIRAGNEKARRAIEQYDQVATTPPPQ